MFSIKPALLLLLISLVAECAPTASPETPSSYDDQIASQGIVGVTQFGNITAYDFANVSLPVPSNYVSWDDASFFAPENYLVAVNSDNDTINALLYASQVAGTPAWIFENAAESKKRDEAYLQLAALVEEALSSNGDYELSTEALENRSIYSWVSSKWVKSGSHATRGAAVGTLASVVGALAGYSFDYGKRSVCASNGDKACMSWSGVSTAFKIALAKQILDDARGVIGSAAMSLEIYDGAYGCKRDLGGSFEKRCGYVDVCVSNRPKGCT